MLTRRDALLRIAGTAVGLGLAPAAGAAPTASFGLAYTSFVVRLQQGRDILKGAPARLDARSFFELCRGFGADGGQVDLSQITPRDAASLAALRREIDDRKLFAELSIPARALESDAAFDEVAAVASALGVTRLRVALLSGRRYESFRTAGEWTAFASHWADVLPRIRPSVEHHRLQLGVENHKDWTAAELAALLERVGSPFIGACVDFGNNIAFLEDPMELVSALAPWAVTTHLKDMAVQRTADGFRLSEVPLGTGQLPLGDMVATLRRAKPDVHFCLEMITRDPLSVPCREDGYWVTFGGRDERKLAAFERAILARAPADPLPRISGLSVAGQLAAEDDNVRRSAAFARDALGL
jgi:sugar phosphate isomerase/epimerase